ncbi:hypothetical protein JCM17846_23770 [Iodidimonas nitroreducens]|uniref:HTH luxR-type domain-containing protein n=1 Tax=Iodidimonas nitroreducens TaxID=1236968 RepID=A0A5A7NAL9_9PROT|nr:LuxR family transcriptional regulator [Iodidimonas nitroreducens]GAK33445.1 transcriptional activator protein BjaR1 [alpha proteobacterium Q-1]GER04695.1 hypothetical protein JCM17846_23770 [Iodidimonas nitroreducens]
MVHFAIVQNFIETVQRCHSLDEAGSVFETTIAELGCEHFACLSHSIPGQADHTAFALHNYPEEWIATFIKNRFDLDDPVLSSSETRTLPWRWDDPAWKHSLNAKQHQILNCAGEFGLDVGFSIPIHSHGTVTASCSVIHKEQIDPDVISAIHLMAFYLYETGRRFCAASRFPKKSPLLTAQQKRCLELVAQGKSDWTIGTILSISRHTATSHVTAAMRRLGVATRVQAVVQALFMNEIAFLDVTGPDLVTPPLTMAHRPSKSQSPSL